MNMDPIAIGAKIAMYFVPFLFAICFHEVAHGWMARRKGDNTAELMGRLSLNPMVHIDWIGTVALPMMAILMPGMPLFGWAKPVPVNPRNLKNPKEDMFWIALAGPLSNILLFVIGLAIAFVVNRTALVSGTLGGTQVAIANEVLKVFLTWNLVLAIFNLLPIHPLDGGKVLARFLPYHINRWLEEHQQHLNMVLLLLLITGFLRYLFIPVNFVQNLCWALVVGGNG